MTHSGYIDWHRLARTSAWTDTGEGSTFVYAYWLADDDTNAADDGVGLLKAEGAHPDWFLHSDRADHVLFSVLPGELVASPNVGAVYDDHLTGAQMLAAVCLGTAKATYAQKDHTGYWWCGLNDLTRPGRRTIKELSMLYLRPPVIVTFLELLPMGQAVPEAEGDPATVALASGSAPTVKI